MKFFFLLLHCAGPSFALTPTQDLTALAQSQAIAEAQVPGVIPGCEAKFEFTNVMGPTDRAILYVHGYSGCRQEMDPMAQNIGKDLGANVFLPRLPGHGIEGKDGLKGVKAEDWFAAYDSSFDMMKMIGRKKIVIGTSTGGSIAVARSAEGKIEDLGALILVSPNFGLKRWDSELMLLPFGIAEFLAWMVFGEYRSWKPRNEEHARFWATTQPSSTLPQVIRAMHRARIAPLEKMTVPTLVLYCEKDNVVDSGAIKKHFARIGSARKLLVEAPCDEDPHIVAGRILSPKSMPVVQKAIEDFLK